MALAALASLALLAGCDEDETSYSNKQIVDALKLEDADDIYAIEGDPFCEVSKKLLNDASEVDDAAETEELVISSAEGNVGITAVAPFACEREARRALNKLDPKPKEE
jgi:nitrous oxide reductase accessory protein NosL